MGRPAWPLLAAGVVLTAVSLPPAHAEAWRFEPAVSAGVGYDDNPRLAPDSEDPDGTSLGRVMGELGVSRYTETDAVRGVARVEHYAYGDDQPGLDDETNAALYLDADRKTERGGYGALVRYEQDTLLRTIDAVEDPGDEVLPDDPDVDVGLVERSVDRRRVVVEPNVSFKMSERSSLKLAYRHTDVSFDDSEELGLVDYTDQRVEGTWSYALSERDDFVAIVRGGRYEPDESDNEFTTAEALVGMNRRFSEVTSAGFSVGAHRTEFDGATVGDDEETGLTAGLYASTRTERMRIRGRLERRLYPSGSGDLVVNNEARMRLSYAVSPRSEVSLRARLMDSESVIENAGDGRRFFEVEPTYEYQLTREWSLLGSYRYRWRERETEDRDGESNQVLVSIRYVRPRSPQ